MPGKRTFRSRSWILAVSCVALAAVACRQDMHDAPRIDPLEASDFFEDGRGSRPLPADTVPRGHLNDDDHMFAGMDAAGNLLDTLPAAMTLDAALLNRGRERYEIFCTPCHDQTGSGSGMIVRRGFQQPESYHTDRLRDMPIGYYFDVMTNGFGQMSSYAPQVPVADRWAIATYIRALQLSQGMSADALSGPQVQKLHAALAGGGAHGAGDHGAGDHGDDDHGAAGDLGSDEADHGGDHAIEDPYDGHPNAPEPGYGQALPAYERASDRDHGHSHGPGADHHHGDGADHQGDDADQDGNHGDEASGDGDHES